MHEGVIHEMPCPDAYFDFVWCRDVVEQLDDLAGALGHDIYEHVEANLHWELFQFLGKLEPIIYVLHRTNKVSELTGPRSSPDR